MLVFQEGLKSLTQISLFTLPLFKTLYLWIVFILFAFRCMKAYKLVIKEQQKADFPRPVVKPGMEFRFLLVKITFFQKFISNGGSRLTWVVIELLD